jgi:hypothetical protein
MTRAASREFLPYSPDRKLILETINERVLSCRGHGQNLFFIGLLTYVWFFPPIDIFEETWLDVLVDIIGMHTLSEQRTKAARANPHCIDYGLSDSGIGLKGRFGERLYDPP